MEFYLNQKSLPMIRKCGNCKNWNQRYMSCRLMKILSAYDHNKEIFLETGENLFCFEHEFKNERILAAEAERVELNGVKEAMEVINKAKTLKNIKQTQFGKNEE